MGGVCAKEKVEVNIESEANIHLGDDEDYVTEWFQYHELFYERNRKKVEA